LRTEAAALLPVLHALSPAAFDTPTVLPGWSVRDVLAHCSAALGSAASGTMHDFSPQSNQRDVDQRRDWPVQRLLAELAAGYADGAAAVDAAAGTLDGLALGEWVHGGDVRDALGLPGAYASGGAGDALALLIARSRARGIPATDVTLADHGRPIRLGADDIEATARLRTDPATLFRLCAGRSPDPARFDLSGGSATDYLIFG
jgi:uncharacterized protein (TIGR03083 family)